MLSLDKDVYEYDVKDEGILKFNILNNFGETSKTWNDNIATKIENPN